MKKLLLLLLGASCLNVNSQVYNVGTIFSGYNDINPDTLINYTVYPYTNESFGINLFDDASDDLKINAEGSVSPGGTIASINVVSTNQHVFVRFGRWDSVYIPAYSFWDVTKVAMPLNAGDQINDPAAIWDTTLLYLTDHTGYGGGNKNVNDWIGNDKYIGLKYQNGSSVAYGWIRVQCKSKDSCYVKDYSYSPVALAIEKTEQAELNFYPNPAKDAFYIANAKAGSIDVASIKLIDVYGNEIKFNMEMKEDKIKIDLGANVAEGYYLVRYTINNRQFSQKFVKLAE